MDVLSIADTYSTKFESYTFCLHANQCYLHVVWKCVSGWVTRYIYSQNHEDNQASHMIVYTSWHSDACKKLRNSYTTWQKKQQ